MDHQEIKHWLREEDPQRLEELFHRADQVRAAHVGDDVHLRGLIEISNYCPRNCHYCGLRADRRELSRYRMGRAEILACARQAADFGYGTVVIQAGEDAALTTEFIAEVLGDIKAATNLAVTLSLGERTDAELRRWRAAGADRYLLRFETSNQELFHRIHPPRDPRQPSDRLAILRRLHEYGYEVGSGVMIGIPGATYDDLARDLAIFRELDLDMIGLGPYIAHPDTPLGRTAAPAADEQVPNSELMTYKALALARILCPQANIPSTTALATLNIEQGRELGLSRGANVVMPNVTPPQYRAQYEIYPAKACIAETAEQCHGCIKGRIRTLGRSIAVGPGTSPNFLARQNA